MWSILIPWVGQTFIYSNNRLDQIVGKNHNCHIRNDEPDQIRRPDKSTLKHQSVSIRLYQVGLASNSAPEKEERKKTDVHVCLHISTWDCIFKTKTIRLPDRQRQAL